MIARVPNHDPDGEEFSGRAVISSTTTASASARGGQKCDGCQKTADCFPSLSISKLCLKDQQKVPETLVSEIVRPSPEATPLLSVSAPVAAAATRVCVDPSGDVVMTPTDQAQEGDANLRKIVAQLHVNLGHPSNDALARAIRLSGVSDDSIQAALTVRRTVFKRLTEPSPVPAASLRRWTELGQCVALGLFMFADITGQHSLFLNMLDMASHYQVVFSGRRQESLDGFLPIPPRLVSHARCS